MLTTKEAIEKRRSIRNFKPDPIPEESLKGLLEAARLAPSGCNAQPWRFKIVRDAGLKEELVKGAYNQAFIATAPVVLVCCADIEGYISGTVSGLQDLGKTEAIDHQVSGILHSRAETMKRARPEDIIPRIAVNVAIAIEHIVLRALDFGLGSCWIRLIDEQKIRQLFGWDENIFVVALLPIGFPAEAPEARKRLPLEEIMID